MEALKTVAMMLVVIVAAVPLILIGVSLYYVYVIGTVCLWPILPESYKNVPISEEEAVPCSCADCRSIHRCRLGV